MIIQANPEDIQALERLYHKRVDYNDAQGIHQWDHAEVMWKHLAEIYEISDFYVVKHNDEIIAAASIVGRKYLPNNRFIYINYASILNTVNKDLVRVCWISSKRRGVRKAILMCA